MSREIKQLIKDAKQAFKEKQFKIAEEKCHEILKEDSKNYYANILLGAVYQENNPTQAAKYLYKATECAGDPSVAYNGLLKCVPSTELPEVCRQYLQRVPSSYEKVHKQLEVCALITKSTATCIEILDNDISKANNPAQIQSAHKSLVEIYMTCSNIEKNWLPLFRKAFESVINDQSIRDHAKVYIKYLKILKNLNEYEVLLNKSIHMLEFYPNEYIPLEMICWIYVNKYGQNDLCIEEKLPKSIETYADEVLDMSGQHPAVNALMAKAIYLYETANYVGARDFLNRANNVSNDEDKLCLRLLADTHLKLHAFTLAEYYYTKIKAMNVKYLKSLVQQKCTTKCQEVIASISMVENDSTLSDDEKQQLIEIHAKALIQANEMDKAMNVMESLSANTNRYNLFMVYKLYSEHQYEKSLEILLSLDGCDTSEYFLLLGQMHFHLAHYPDALSAFLNATKLEPYNADCFLWLGTIYQQNGDTERSRKCFEKSCFLNPQQEQSVIRLSKIYRELLEWELNEKLLQTAAQTIPNTPCKWATILLGFHYLAQCKFDDAIAAFRAVLRMDSCDFTSWEGLADSYLKRGSFSSALKVYRKICELDGENVYAQLQVANVLTVMRLHKDSIKTFECLLKERPTYVPALKGIADAHIGIANYYLEQRLVGRSKAHAEEAVSYLIRAIEIRSNLICLWRLMANCFDFIAALPTSKAFLKIPGSLANENNDEFVTLHDDKLYELSARFYCRAIKLNAADLSLWYELSLNYYNRSIKYGTSETRKKHLDLAAEVAKHIIKEAPHKWKYWNLLGVICTTKDINNLALAQHCFIKALELDRKLAVAWTNLGILYLNEGQTKMANVAFKQAQQSEPTYANAWTGQAQIAEILSPNDAIELLRHSISLGYHDESAIQYTYSVCSLLNDTDNDKRKQYYIEHLDAISSGIDSITWYCNANESHLSAEALSFLGYLNHYQRNWPITIRAFQNATDRIEPSVQRDKMLCNLAYSLLKVNKPIEAVTAFENVNEATFGSTIGLAHSHFKAKNYESSYAVYENALEWLADNDTDKSLILVALSSMIYAFRGENDAKMALYQCIGQPNRPIEALLSACALGILHDDIQLSELVLKELKEYERDDRWCYHIAFLTSELYLKMNQKKKGLKYLYTQVHHFPDKPLLRKVLASYLLNNTEKNEKHSMAATRMVQATIVMQRTHSKREMTSMDVAKLLVLASEAMRCINPVKSKHLVQKAIHANPHCREAWAAKQLLCA